MAGKVKLTEAICPQCKGEGFYYRLPAGMNPFAASIEVTAYNMRRIQCYCPAGRAQGE